MASSMKSFPAIVFIMLLAAGVWAFHTLHMRKSAPAWNGTARLVMVKGQVTIIRKGTVEVAATANSDVNVDDMIRTEADSAARIVFSDNSCISLGEKAQIAIKDFAYNKETGKGTSVFSLVQGIFIYTSGLIAKSDPETVNIQTPVGSIGIRGTVVAGNIKTVGDDSRFTVLDGAVVITNGGGTAELRDKLQTAVLNKYDTAPRDMGKITPQAMVAEYDSVSTVAADALSPFDRDWYKGGTLQKATVAEWTAGAPEDQVATAGDFAAALHDIEDLSKASKDQMKDVREQARSIRSCINHLVELPNADPEKHVSELVVMCAVSKAP